MAYVNLQGRRLPFIFRYAIDLATYRHLAANLVAADLRARFRRSYFGILWAILQPLGFALIIAYVWHALFEAQSYWDYALYVFSGLIVWDYFATVMNVSQDSLSAAEGYLKQTRIPFVVFQMRTALSGHVVMMAAFLGLIGLMAALGKAPELGTHLLYVPAFFVVVLFFMLPLTIIMSILGTKFRDLRYITYLAVQALFFVSPVMLGREVFDAEKMALIKLFNPMAHLLDMFREPLFHAQGWTSEQVFVVAIWIVVAWIVAIWLAISEGRRLVFSL